jgi:hypothetical protein
MTFRDRSTIAVGVLAACAFAAASAALQASARSPVPIDKPVILFNGKNLDGWTTYIRHVDENGKAQPDIGTRTDPKGVFKVEDGVIHVSGAEYGCLTTEDEFENYHLVLEFKWGKNRYLDRKDKVRDSGVLLHCVGPDKIWTKSIECQIQEGDCGDFWMVSGTTLKCDGAVETSYKKKKSDAEKPSGEWNTIEVICDGDKITNIVNGVVVNSGSEASVTKGRILLQSEGAEVFYRKVELRPLGSSTK